MRLYNHLEINNQDIPNNIISCGLYFHGAINTLIGNHDVYVESVITAKNDKISSIELSGLRQDGIYDAYTMLNGIKHELKLFYWKIKTKQNTIIHRGLAVSKQDKEAIKIAKQKLRAKKVYL